MVRYVSLASIISSYASYSPSYYHSCTMIASTLGKTIGCCHRVRYPCIRLIACQSHALSAIAWDNCGQFLSRNDSRIDSLFLLQTNISPQGLHPHLIRHHHHPGRHKATISPTTSSKCWKIARLSFAIRIVKSLE